MCASGAAHQVAWLSQRAAELEGHLDRVGADKRSLTDQLADARRQLAGVEKENGKVRAVWEFLDAHFNAPGRLFIGSKRPVLSRTEILLHSTGWQQNYSDDALRIRSKPQPPSPAFLVSDSASVTTKTGQNWSIPQSKMNEGILA